MLNSYGLLFKSACNRLSVKSDLWTKVIEPLIAVKSLSIIDNGESRELGIVRTWPVLGTGKPQGHLDRGWHP